MRKAFILLESVEIQLLLHEAQSINLALYDMRGRLLWHQPDAQKTAGRHNWILPTDELERGVYVLRIKCGEQLFVRRLIKQ